MAPFHVAGLDGWPAAEVADPELEAELQEEHLELRHSEP